MTAAEATAQGRRGLWAALLFVFLVHALWWLVGDAAVRSGGLADGDGFLRLLRVERLIKTGGWYDPRLPRADAPFGLALHWTRPLDALLAAPALAAAPFLGLKAAVYWAGALVGPVLHLALAAALAWAVGPTLSGVAAAVAGALTALQMGVLGYAVVGHADHHVLLALLVVLAFGCVLRALSDAGGTEKPALAAGLLLAAGMWVSAAEAGLAAALALVAVGGRWIVDGEGFVEAGRRLAFGLVLGLAAALLLERGPAGFLAVAYDRVSAAHLTGAVLAFFFWAVVAAFRHGRWLEGRGGRLVAAALGALMSLALLKLAFPPAFRHPLAGADPLIRPVLAGIAEFQPLKDAPHALLYLGAALPALPWAAWRLRRTWRAAEPGRWGWLLLLALAIVYAALTTMWIRWSIYAGVFLAAVLADLATQADAAIDRRFRPPGRVAVKVLALLALTAGPLAVGAAAVFASAAPATAAAANACPLRPLAEFLNAPPWGERPRTIVASVNFGPELLYRTPHRVLATLHHRNADGIRDSILILAGRDDGEIRKLIAGRGVDLLLICVAGPDDGYFTAGRAGDVLYRRLAGGAPPVWLEPVALPKATGGGFRLFRVRRE